MTAALRAVPTMTVAERLATRGFFAPRRAKRGCPTTSKAYLSKNGQLRFNRTHLAHIGDPTRVHLLVTDNLVALVACEDDTAQSLSVTRPATTNQVVITSSPTYRHFATDGTSIRFTISTDEPGALILTRIPDEPTSDTTTN